MRALRLTADSLLLMITIATQSISAKISPKDQATLDAQVSSGRQVKYGSQVIDLLSPSLLQAASGAPSSWAAVSPRWIVADERLTMPNAPASIDSGKIIKSFTKGPGWIDAVPAAPGQTSVTMHREYTRLFSDELLFACWVLDPDSYAFYFVAGLSIVVVPPVSAPIYEEGPPTICELIVGLCICEVMRGATSCGASHLVQGVAAAVWCVPGCMDGCGWMREFLRKVQSRK